MLRKLGENLRTFLMPAHSESYVPEPVHTPSVKQNHINFSDLLPYIAWLEDHRLFVLEGEEANKVEALGFCLEMSTQTGASEEMSELVSTLFSKYPAGSGVQWMLLGSPVFEEDMQDYLEIRRAQKNLENQELYVNLVKRQAQHLLNGVYEPIVKHQHHLVRKFRLVMSVTLPATDFTDVHLLKQLSELRDITIETLKTNYQFQREWEPEDLINWCALLLNLQDTLAIREQPKINYHEGKVIKKQIVNPNTVIRVTEDGLVFGLPQKGNEYMATCLTIRSYPKEYNLHGMGRLIGDVMQPSMGYSCPYLLMCGIEILDYQKHREITLMKSARATQKAASPMARFLPDIAKTKEDWDIAHESFDAGKGMVRLYHEVVLFDRPESMRRSIQNAKSIFRYAKFELVEDTFMQVQAFLSTLPLALTPSMAKDIRLGHRMYTKTVTNAISLAPLLAEWQGLGNPILPLVGRRGQLMWVDVFSNASGNYNVSIVGKSGSGKSVLMNLIILSYLSVGARVWIIDVGHSYKKLCDQLGGQYIELSRNSDVRLNPFSMVVDINEDIEMLTSLFAHMCSPSKQLDDHLKAVLKAHLLSVWYDHAHEATVDQVQNSLINNCALGGPNPLQNDPEWIQKVQAMEHEERQKYCDPRVRDLGMALFPFTSAGNFGKYFAGAANIDFTNNFIVLELEELAQIPELRTVMMFLIMYRITQNMYMLDRRQLKFCLIDEAWQLLQGGSSGDFIENGYRRARKYRGSFGTATQNMSDYDKSVAARAALDNSDWMFLLAQRPESLAAMVKQEKLILDKEMEKILRSVHTQQDVYAEVYVRAGDSGSGVGRILLDPYTLLMFSSKGEDVAAIKSYQDNGYSIHEALEAVLADKGVEGFVHPDQRQLAEAQASAGYYWAEEEEEAYV